jgi:O-antigen ligase
MQLNALGLDSTFVDVSIREWLRIFSFLMIYLMVMQLKGRIAPQKVTTSFFLALVVPLSFALSQVLRGLPRVDGTLGHPNNFSTFTILFLILALWKLSCADKKAPWLLMTGVMVFFMVGSKSMTGLAMLGVFAIVYFLPRLRASYILWGIIFSVAVVGLFLSSDYGQGRIEELYMTPILNRDMDWSYALSIQLSDSADANSFNWRIAQWTFLLKEWSLRPMLGYGLGTTFEVSIFNKEAHGDYIRALVETGIVGLGAFMVLLGGITIRLVQFLQNSRYVLEQQHLARTLLSYFFALMFGMLTGNIWIQTAPLIYFFIFMAILGWDWEAKTQ